MGNSRSILGLEHERDPDSGLMKIANVDRAAVEIHDGFHYRQAEARPFARRFGGIEGLEDFSELVLRNSMPGIVDLRHDDVLADPERFRTAVGDIRADT